MFDGQIMSLMVSALLYCASLKEDNHDLEALQTLLGIQEFSYLKYGWVTFFALWALSYYFHNHEKNIN